MQKEKVKMCKTTLPFILLFTGYLVNSMATAAGTTAVMEDVAADTATVSPSLSTSPAPKTTLDESEHVPDLTPPSQEQAKRLSTVLVAGISISFVLLFILVVLGLWCARKRSQAGMNSDPSAEPGVTLKKISTHEAQQEWPFDRALH